MKLQQAASPVLIMIVIQRGALLTHCVQHWAKTIDVCLDVVNIVSIKMSNLYSCFCKISAKQVWSCAKNCLLRECFVTKQNQPQRRLEFGGQCKTYMVLLLQGGSNLFLSSQTHKLMAATKFSDYLGLNHYKKAKKSKHFIHQFITLRGHEQI